MQTNVGCFAQELVERQLDERGPIVWTAVVADAEVDHPRRAAGSRRMKSTASRRRTESPSVARPRVPRLARWTKTRSASGAIQPDRAATAARRDVDDMCAVCPRAVTIGVRRMVSQRVRRGETVRARDRSAASVVHNPVPVRLAAAGAPGVALVPQGEQPSRSVRPLEIRVVEVTSPIDDTDDHAGPRERQMRWPTLIPAAVDG